MVDSQIIAEIKEYYKKLQRIVNYEADFGFAGFKLIKKTKIDDIMCCIIATLPQVYKNYSKTKDGKKMPSVVSYNLLFKALKQKFIFNSNLYIVNASRSIAHINSILRDIEHDINYAEKNT